MKSLLSEEKKKQIREETAADVTAKVTLKVTEKKSVDYVLAVMKRLNASVDEAMNILGIKGDLRKTVREKIEQA